MLLWKVLTTTTETIKEGQRGSKQPGQRERKVRCTWGHLMARKETYSWDSATCG